MLATTIKSDLDVSTLLVVETVISSVLKMMPDTDRFRYLFDFKESLEDILNEDDPDLESAQGIAELIKMDWCEDKYLEYIKIPIDKRYSFRANDPDINVVIFGLVMGLKIATMSLTELVELLESGQEFDEFYLGITDFIWFTEANEKDLQLFQSQILNELVTEFNKCVENGFSNREELRRIEIEEYGMIFKPDGATHKWDYIAEHLAIETSDVEQFYKLRRHIDDGTYILTLYSFNRYKRLDYALLFAIRDYIKFLESGETVIDTEVETEVVQSSTLNLWLRKDYHKNLQQAYKLMEDDFVSTSYEKFCGIFIPQKFSGKVKIAPGTTVAEIKFFLLEIAGCLNSSAKIWRISTSLFEFHDGTPLTENSFNTAKIIGLKREHEISKIAQIVKTI